MDFPDNAATNVHRVDGITEIHWNLYTSNGQDAVKFANSANDSWDGETISPDVVYYLRREGKYVWIDAESRQIWAFRLLRSDAEVDGPSYGLEKVSSGTLHAADMLNEMGPSTPVLRTNETAPTIQPSLDNVEAPRSELPRSSAGHSHSSEIRNTKQAAPSLHGIPSYDMIHDKAMAAISCTLSHFLADDGDWSPLGSGTSVSCYTLEDTPSYQMWPDSFTAKTTTVTWKVSWSPLGSLALTTIFTNIPKLCRVESVLSKPKSISIPGTPIFLSPSGLEAQYIQAERTLTGKSQTSATKEIKDLIIARLARQGIEVVKDGRWALVQVAKQTIGSQDFGPKGRTGASLLTLWPARLIFFKEVASKGEPDVMLGLFTAIHDDLKDPLAGVESWLSRKTARKEALAAKQQQDKIGATELVKESEESEDEFDVSGAMSPGNRYAVSQDLSSIYPTPPEGLRSQDLDLVANNEHQNTPSDIESRSNVDGVDVNMEYSDEPDGDTFGNMEMEMFTEIDLTEADFNFFDEPGIDDEIDTNGHKVSITDAVFAGKGLEQSMEYSSPEVESHKSPQSTSKQPSEAHVHRTPSGSTESAEITPQNPDNLDSNALSQLPRKSGNRSRENTPIPPRQPISLNQPTRGQNFSEEEIGCRHRSSFLPALRRELKFDFDSKYWTEGRFGSQSESLADFEYVEQTHKHIRNTIPHIGIQEDISSNSESEMDKKDDFDERQSSSSLDDSSAGSISKMDMRTFQNGSSDRGSILTHPATPLSPISARETPMNNSSFTLLDMPPLVLFARTIYSPLDRLNNISYHPPNLAFAIKDIPFIEVAQLVVDQAVLGALFTSVSVNPLTKPNGQSDNNQPQTSQDVTADVVSRIFPTSRNCSLAEHNRFVSEKAGSNLISKDAVSQGRRISDIQESDSSIHAEEGTFKLQAPFMSVRRMGTATDIMVSAIPFWEELNLWPSCGPKDVNAFCVCPDNCSLRVPVMDFLSAMKGTYQACNLGNHAIGCDLEDYPDGFVPVNATGKTAIETLLTMESACEKLGIVLGEKGLCGGNTIIYMLNYLNIDEALPGLCAAFSTIFRAYQATLKGKQIAHPNDLVLQVVSLSFVYSPDKIVIPSPTDHKRLAFQVFDRCGPSNADNGTKLPYLCAPAIRLAMSIPKAIDFRLTSDSTEKLFSGDRCLHIAYSWCYGQQWLTASWTDGLGVLQWNAAYWLGKDEHETWQPFARIADEIWETTLEMVQPHNNSWKLFLVKDSPVSVEELDIWLPLFAEIERPSTSCILLTITENPTLAFPLPYKPIVRPDSTAESPLTPTSTPYDTSLSPEALVHVSTPGWGTAQASTPGSSTDLGDHDASARLLDITNETWGICTQDNVDFPMIQSDLCTGQASGYLVKRAGFKDEDGLLPVGIDVIYPQKLPTSLFKEVLWMYQNLAVLARVRRLVDPVQGVLPWHVAAARKAHDILTTTMRHDAD